MSVAQGRYGKITLNTTVGKHVISEIGNWSISGNARDMIEHTAFGDTVKKFAPGMLDAGTLTFSGFFSNLDSSGQGRLIACFTSGKGIGTSSGGTSGHATRYRKLRLWVSTSTNGEFKGFWGTTGSTGSMVYITGIEMGQDKNGLGTISFTGRISHKALKFSSST